MLYSFWYFLSLLSHLVLNWFTYFYRLLNDWLRLLGLLLLLYLLCGCSLCNICNRFCFFWLFLNNLLNMFGIFLNNFNDLGLSFLCWSRRLGFLHYCRNFNTFNLLHWFYCSNLYLTSNIDYWLLNPCNFNLFLGSFNSLKIICNVINCCSLKSLCLSVGSFYKRLLLNRVTVGVELLINLSCFWQDKGISIKSIWSDHIFRK